MVDSTGLSIVGEGEWAAVKHGGNGKRAWKKLHLGVDRSGVIVAELLTDGNAGDSNVFNTGSQSGNTTVELSNIDPAMQSFVLTASGSITNTFYPDGGFRYTSLISLAFNNSGADSPDITGVSILGSALPAESSADFDLGDPQRAILQVGFPFPPPMDPFTWSATFELTTTGPSGSYMLFQAYGSEICHPLPSGGSECDGGGRPSDDVFEFAIVPEPSAALLFALGVVIVSRANHRARRR